MVFVRLAGCSVGRGTYPFSCKMWDGNTFLCDTDYHKTTEMGIEQIIFELTSHNVDRVCLTGGEPFMHPIGLLILKIIECGYNVHVETSGTQRLPEVCEKYKNDVWITVSPKHGAHPVIFERADEIKVLVDRDTSLEDVLGTFGRFRDKVWLQPVDDDLFAGLPPINIQKCLNFIKHEPSFRLSIQMHKVIGVK